MKKLSKLYLPCRNYVFLSLSFRQQWRLQQANRDVFMLPLHADVQRDVRAVHKIKETPTVTVVASHIVRYFSFGLFPLLSSLCVVVSESEVIEETIHPHTSTPDPRALRPQRQPSGWHDWPNSTSNTHTHTHIHTHIPMTSTPWPPRARQRHTLMLTHFDISLSKEPVCTLPPTTIITINAPL